MLYDKYKNKMIKRTKVKNVFIRFRVLFISLAAVLLIITTTMLSIFGLVIDEKIENNVIEYGQQVDFNASAIFNDTEYEYYDESSGAWTKEKPRLPGTYKARGYSKNIFGQARPGKEITFTIAPKKIEVSSLQNMVVFGDNPDGSADLCYGDTIEKIDYTYDDLSAKETFVTPIKDSIIICDEEGNDVTSYYDISCKKNDITFLPRQITIKTEDASKIYDSLPLKCDLYEISQGSLAFDDSLVSIFTSEITSSGSIENKQTYKVINKDSLDVSNNYEIKFINGKLSVGKRPVIVHTSSSSKVYDGSSLTSKDFNIDEKTPIIENHSAKVVTSSSITDASKVDNFMTLGITDASDNDVTNNYSITYVPGSLEITKKDVTITSLDGEYVYDGTEAQIDDFKVSSSALVEGHTISANSTVEAKAKGVYDNTFDCAILDEEGNDVTKNYNITKKFGKVNVLPRKVEFTSLDGDYTYDNQKAHYDEYQLTDNTLGEGDNFLAKSLVEGINIGQYDNKFEVSIFDENEVDVTDNYELSYIFGKVNILPRPIEITSSEGDYVYDGNKAVVAEFNVTKSSLIEGHTFYFNSLVNEIDVGTYDNVFDGIIKNEAGEEVTDNYDITYLTSKINIIPLDVTISSIDGKYTYDETAHHFEEYNLVDSILVKNDRFESHSIFDKFEVGEYENVFETKFYDENNRDITKNYNVIPQNGTITILPLEVEITSIDGTHVYDGEAPIIEKATITSGELLPNHQFSVKSKVEDTDVGTIKNLFDVKIVKGEKDVTKNYLINKVYGNIEVTPRPVTIKSNDVNEVYSSEYPSSFNVSIISGTLVKDHQPNGNPLIEEKYVGTYDYIFDVQIVDGKGVDKTNNYTITKEYGNLTIIKREITIASNDTEQIYDGHEANYQTFSEASGSLGINDKFANICTVTGIDVGIYESSFSPKIVDKTGFDVTYNYEVKTIFGKIEILPRPITITSISGEYIYNDQPARLEGCSSKEGQLVLDHYIESIYNNQETDVGKVNNTFVSKIYAKSNNRDVTFNYDIEYVYGIITILPRDIHVQTPSAEKIYDDTHLMNTNFTYTLEDLVVGHKVTYNEPYTSIIEVGTKKNEVTITIYKNETIDVTRNYNPIYDYGTLKITPRTIHVFSGSSSKVYDDEEFTYTKYWYTEGDLVINHSIEYLKPATSIIDVSKVDNEVLAKIYKDNKDISYNYEFIYEYGTLEITPRPIDVYSIDNTKMYDATPLVNGNFWYADGQLVTKHQVNWLEPYSSITDVGAIKNEINLTITRKNGDKKDVTSNYLITKHEGNLVIIPRDINITTDSDSKIYDGTKLECERYKIGNGDLLSIHKLVITKIPSIINAGKIDNKIEFRIVDKSNEIIDVTRNYNFIYHLGTLEILPIEIHYTSGSKTKAYDGTALTCDSYTLDEKPLILGHIITLDSNNIPSIIRAGSIPNEFKFIVSDKDGNDMTINYKFIGDEIGTLTITPLPIDISSESKEKFYDRKPLTHEVYSYEAEDLLEGETLTFIKPGKSITKIGSVINTPKFIIANKDGEDVTSCYMVIEHYGTLTITGYNLDIYSSTVTKEYDGLPLVDNNFTYDETQIHEGHYLEFKLPAPSITEIGKIKHSVEVMITDVDGFDVTDYYDIKTHFGELIVTRITINITTPSASKDYDGLPLFKHIGVTLDEDKLLEGHTVVYQVTGEQTLPGQSFNTIVYNVVDSANKIMDDYYIFKEMLGVLTVIETPDYDSGDSQGPTVDDEFDNSGKISSSGSSGGGGGGGGADTKPVASFVSDYTGKFYLRTRTFGDYLLETWGQAPNPYSGESIGINPYYLTANALKQSHYSSYEVKITYVNMKADYAMPYFTIDGLNVDMNESLFNGNIDEPYTLHYYPYEYSRKRTPKLKDQRFIDFEEKYYQYVLDNYLSLPESTKESMLKIAKGNALYKNSRNIIADVADYISNAAIYNKEFADFPMDSDYATYFLTEGKEGICQHFATAAVTMYRALGIPARYTIGFAGSSIAGVECFVSPLDFHAWVEVYIHELGWIPVEVTGGSIFGLDDENSHSDSNSDSDSDSEMPKEIIKIKPIDVDKGYDGTSLYPKNKLEVSYSPTLEKLIDEGYTYKVSVVGTQTEIGESESTITSFRLFDSDGKDVTEKYVIIYRHGLLKVTKTQIVFIVHSQTKEYDGQPLTYTHDDCTVIAPEGVVVDYTLVGNLDEIGYVEGELKDISITRNGMDVSNDYYLKIIEGYLEILPFSIEITTGSSVKVYDGTPLTDASYWISMGSLKEGHTLKVETGGQITDVGKEKNKISSIEILDENGNDVLDLYDISYRGTQGVLEVTIPN